MSVELSGKVIINVLDAETMEVVNTIEQSNVITKLLHGRISQSGGFSTSVYLSPSNVPSYEDWCAVPDCITNGYIPIGVTSPLSFPAAGGNAAYVQLMMRFDAPTATRTIYTVGLPYTSTSLNGKTQYVMNAYVNLSAPCVQTTTQIMDVYYRVQATESTVHSYNSFNIKASDLLYNLFYSPSRNSMSGYGQIPIYGSLDSSSTTQPIESGRLFISYATDSLDARRSTTDNSVSINATSITDGYNYYTWTQTTAQGVGILYGAMTTTQNGNGSSGWGANSVQNIIPPNGSKIQPIFSHAGSTLSLTTATHFLDVIPSPGSGTVNIGGTWTTGNLPELYKISIVDGGAVGTATYTFEKRNHFGFLSDRFVTNVAMLPGAFSVHTPGTLGTASLVSVMTSKPHTADVNHPQTTPGSYSSRIERYDNTHFISYDKTGVSRYNCANHFVELWDSTTTPALAATNLRQACVNNSDGSIWAACADTGVYRISADGLTVTNFTTANGLPSNICRAIDMGRNNTVWVYTDSGLATTIDSGVTWTTYNTGTTPAFNSPTLTAEPAAVWYMRVDPTHADDRICIVRSADATTNYAIGMVWWNRATGVVTTSNGPTVTTIAGGYRRNPSYFNVSDNDSMWVFYTNSTNGYIIGYNYTSIITLTAPSSQCLPSVMFVRNATNTKDLLLMYSPKYDSSSYGYGYHFPTHSTITDTSTRVTVSLINNTGITETITTTPAVTCGRTVYLDIASTSCVYLGNGVIAGYQHTSSYYSWQGGIAWITSISGDGTPSGGSLEYLVWEKYGWDGSTWVLGNTNAKTTHATDQPLIHGLTCNFANGAVGTSFFATDYYTGSVNDGILKNNAMTVSSYVLSYTIPTDKLTDFDGVIRLYPWTTGLVSWRKSSASITKNGDGSLANNIPSRSNQVNACSKQRVFGDFSISGTFSPNTLQYYVIGISRNYIMEYIYLREDQYPYWGFNVQGNNVYIRNSANTTFWTGSNVITGNITWNITRVGNTITFYVNGVSRYTTTDASYSFGVNAKFTMTATNPTTIAINPVTIDSSGNGYYVGMGNSTSGTGIYDTKQYKHTVVNTSDLSINGTPLTVINNTSATPPASGGCSYSPEEGILWCNSDDAGKAITGSYIVNYHVSTPCNVPPV